MTAATSLLCARDVGLRRGARTILEGLDLDVAVGDRIAISGRSGSGKTSLLLVLAGLLAPTAGSVSFPEESDAVYVPQGPSLVPELSALDNAALPLRLRGVAPAVAREQAAGELQLLGLGEAQEGLPWQLSVGMQQRAALARALTLRPRLMLADEPTGALDRATGSQVLSVLLEQTNRNGAALIVATHDAEVAERFTRRLTLRDGRLETAQ
ncbi:MAG: ATP-binding cassette domain-containing protein [Actinomycetota bacterium]|nr:ATP-binding cassette domain-containing protein [Actinomycetota bacterium]